MDINRMRLGLVYIFAENEKLSKESKIQLINFIESANEHQLKALALDGELITPDKLDEQAQSILDARFVAESDVYDKIESASLMAVDLLNEAIGAVATGAVVGGLAGLLSPIPGGMAAGALAGAGMGALYNWRKEQMRKLKQYCKSKYPDDNVKRQECMIKGQKIVLTKVHDAKEKAKKSKAKKTHANAESMDMSVAELDQEKFNTGVKVGATVGAAALAARHMMKRRKEKAALKAQQMQQKMQQAKMAQK
jgi:hypothetical protein